MSLVAPGLSAAGTGEWRSSLRSDPSPWLLGPSTPAVRHLALRDLLDRPGDDPEVVEARRAAMRADPIAAILAAQHPDGYWEKPGAGYATKYRGTVWQLIFLDQLGADAGDPRIRRACDYVLDHSIAPTGGFGASGQLNRVPPPSAVIHCLNGNLLRAVIGFGWLDDPRVQGAIEWEARAITGEGVERWYASGTSGAGFACAANEGLACAWGAAKAVLGLARIPIELRSPLVRRAIATGAEFLLGRDPLVADYPMGWGNVRPSSSWFKLGFPSAYVTDVLQVLEALTELGHGRDPRLAAARDWLLAQADDDGRWRNRYAYNGKTWVDFEVQGGPSRWVTLRACRVLRRMV
ncbi:MAG: nitrogen fixation protein NifH [Chloroflexota bacterium]|nr:MAG: nitrogen fixation protein NifH [Chloroflexota bacterium]